MLGKILWWSTKDQNGIIVDSWQNEYYFDSSVLKIKSECIKRNSVVEFEVNESITDCLCAKNIRGCLVR